jgi:lytic murein transglycosylase
MTFNARDKRSSKRSRPVVGRFLRFLPLWLLAACLFQMPGEARAESFDPQWLQGARGEAVAAGVKPETFDRIFAKLTPDCAQPGVLCAPSSAPDKTPPMPPQLRGLPQSCNRVTQLEFVHPARYFPERSMAHLVAKGKAILAKWAKDKPAAYAHLQKVASETGVGVPVLLALWGRETGFGSEKLKHNAVRALASLAAFGAPSRRDWARGELIAALKLIDEGRVTFEGMTSSYAGAIGLTQLTPDEYLTYAVDGDGDGKSDIWNSAIDALASTANVLKHRGWRGDLKSWGYEIVLPSAKDAPFDCTLEGRFTRKSFTEWTSAYGLRRARKNAKGASLAFPKLDQEGYVVMPAGAEGPSFLVTGNFDVLRSYNTSDNYSLFVGAIADRIGCEGGGDCGFATPWAGASEKGGFDFSVANLCRLQIGLKDRGFYPGEPDGLFGGQTRVAIGRYQKSLGQKPSCFPTDALFKSVTVSAAAR